MSCQKTTCDMLVMPNYVNSQTKVNPLARDQRKILISFWKITKGLLIKVWIIIQEACCDWAKVRDTFLFSFPEIIHPALKCLECILQTCVKLTPGTQMFSLKAFKLKVTFSWTWALRFWHLEEHYSSIFSFNLWLKSFFLNPRRISLFSERVQLWN